eukprot:5564697-Prymnesium_polylepis.1
MEHAPRLANVCWKAVGSVDAGAHRDRKVDAPVVISKLDGAEDVVSAARQAGAVQRVRTHRKLLLGTPMAAPTQHRWLFLGA